MSPKDSPATKLAKPFVPLPKPLPVKKDEEKSKKDKPKVKILEGGHKKSTSQDTGYASGFSSPWSLEERSPFDYSPRSKSQSQSPKPRADKEVYEVVNGQAVVRRYSTKRGDTQHFTRRPKATLDDDIAFSPETYKDPYKDRYKEAKTTTKILQQALADETEKAQFNHDAAKQQEAQRLAQIDALQAEIRKLKLKKQMSDSKAAEAEKKYKLSEIERLEEKGRELQRREKEFELERKQWKEIEAAPSPLLTRKPTLPPLLQQSKPERRNTSQSPYTNTALTAQPPTTLISGNAGLDAIFEAQRDDDRRRAQEAREARETREAREKDSYYPTRPATKETGRTANDYRRPRRDDRYI